MPPKLKNGLSLAIFALITALVVWKMVPRQHIPAVPSGERWGMMDFYLNSYLPAELLAAGENPYGEVYVAEHPWNLGYPLFSPLSPTLHIPLTLLPFAVAGWVNFAIHLALILLLASICLRICRLPHGLSETLLLATVIIVSRPGYSSLFLGQFTPICVIGTYLALQYGKDRPKLSALGLLCVSLKAQFFIPVALYMFCRRHYRALTLGASMSAIGAILPLLWIAKSGGGILPLATNFLQRYGEGVMPAITAPGTQFMRMDLGDTLSKFFDIPLLTVITTCLLLGLGCWLVLRERKAPITSPTYCLAFSALLLSIYHCAYDAMLMVLPILALWFRADSGWKHLSSRTRYALVGLLGFPLVNHLVYQIPQRSEFGSAAWKIGTSLNTFAIAGAILLLGFALYRNRVRHSITVGSASVEGTYLSSCEVRPARIQSRDQDARRFRDRDDV